MKRLWWVLVPASCAGLLAGSSRDLGGAEEADRLLYGFESEAELAGLSSEAGAPLQRTAERHTEGAYALQTTLPPGPYPGLSIPVPPDWRAYEALKFDLWCQRHSFLGIRIDDVNSVDYHTRFNQDGSVVRQGWNHIQVPLDEVAKAIDLGRVRALVIFLLQVAEPTTLCLDNLRLGAYEEDLDDRPVPGELGEKKEFAWSMEVVTPHVPWGRPLAGGPIRALLVPGIHAGREAIELRQRLDLDATTVTVEKTWDVNRWGLGDFYGQRGDIHDFRLQYRYLEQALTGGNYEVIVLPLVHGWNALTKKSREALREQVRRGTGLVLIHPYVGQEGKDLSIWELSPLLHCADDTIPEDGYVRIPPGALAAGHPRWTALADHPITRGVPLDLLPYGNMELYRYEANGEVILSSEAGPVAAVKEFGQGRVVALGYRNEDLLPALSGPNFPTWEYWEYLYSLLARAILWAARRDMPAQLTALSREGDTVVAEVTVAQPGPYSLVARFQDEYGTLIGEAQTDLSLGPGGEASGRQRLALPEAVAQGAGRQIVDLRLRAGENAVDWATLTFEQPKPIRILGVPFDQPAVPQGQPVTGGVSVEQRPGANGAGVPPAEVVLELVDDEERVIARESHRFEPEANGRQWVPYALATDSALDLHARVRASVQSAGRLLDRQESSRFVITPAERIPDGLNFHAFMAGVNEGNAPYLRAVYRQRLRDMGAEAGTTFGGIPNSLGVQGLGVYAYSAAAYRERKRLYQETKDKQYLIRDPCLNSPEWRARTRQAILERAPEAKRYHPFSYYVNDEGSLTSYTDAHDFCFGPHCLARFRAWLQTVYPALEALNATWQTDFRSWEEVMPMTTEEVRQHAQNHHPPSYAAWADHRTFMEMTYADAYRFIRDTLREVDPEGELRISGTQATVAYNGCDWWRITRWVKDTGPYTTGDQWELHRSFLFADEEPVGAARIGGWTGYGSSGEAVRHFIWNGLFHRLGYMNIFWQYACLNPDLTFSRSAADMSVVFKELRDGLGMLLNHARRAPTPVALHYSLPSCHAATILDQFPAWEAHRQGWIHLLNDLGYQFDFLSQPQIEAGELSRRGFRALILPYSMALSDREVEALAKFTAEGGVLLPTGPWGTFDEHVAPRDPATLRAVRLPEAATLAPIEEAMRGSGPLSAARQTLQQLLSDAQIPPVVTVTDGQGNPLLRCQRTAFRDGGAVYITLLRDHLAGQTLTGPDGVEYVRDGGATSAPEPITVTLPQARHVYDVRAGRYLGYVDRFKSTLASAEAKVFALLPYQIGALSISAPRAARRGQKVEVQVRLAGLDGEPLPHVVHLEVRTPQGQRHPLYSQNALTEEDTARWVLPLAYNDPPGPWWLVAREVVSGITARAEVVVE
jgi:hypothetical protein